MLLLSATLLLLSLSTVGSGELGTCSLATSFDAWYKYNFDVFQPGNPFVIEDIPNPLCALMTNGQSTGCSECSSKLQQWYLSHMCMAACHEHNCAPYDDLEVECTFAPDNFLSGRPEELKWGAKCICPANTIHAGEEMTVADTSYKQMLDEWNRNRCYDSKAVGSVGVVACDPFACSASNISWCDTNAVCTTNHSNPHGFTCDSSGAALTGMGLDGPINGAICSSASDCLSSIDSVCSRKSVGLSFYADYCFDKCSSDSQCYGNTRCQPRLKLCSCIPKFFSCWTDRDCCSNNCNDNYVCVSRDNGDPCVTDIDCECAMYNGVIIKGGKCNRMTGLCEEP